MPFEHVIAVLKCFQTYCSHRMDMLLMICTSKINLLPLLCLYWYRDLSRYRKTLRSVWWKRHTDSNVNLEADERKNRSAGNLEGLAYVEEKKLMSLTDIQVLNGGIFNMLNATRPHTAKGWKNIPMNAIQNVLANELLETVRINTNKYCQDGYKH